MQQRTNSIKFYSTGENYDIFSNVTDVGFTIYIGGKKYDPLSSEAIYQGLKAYSIGDTLSAENFFNDQRSPGAHLQREGNLIQNKLFMNSSGRTNNSYEPYQPNYKSFNAPESVDVKEQVMYEILLAKFTQNPALLKALLETGDKTLIENTQSNARYNDEFWGNGHSGNGRNALGIALMRARETLRNELTTYGKTRVRTGISEDLADALSIPPSKEPRPPQYVSQTQLDTQQPAITVSEFKSLKGFSHTPHSPSSKHTSSLVNPFEGKDSPTQFIENKLREQGENVKVSLGADISDKKKGVLKIQFTSGPDSLRDSLRFANWLKSTGVYVYHENNSIIMSLEGKKGKAPKAEQVLERLGLENYGRRNPQPTINTLHQQWAYQVAEHSHTPNTSQGGLFQGKQSPTDFIKDRLAKKRLKVIAVAVGPDSNDASKGVLKIKFKSTQNAADLADSLKRQGIPVFQKNEFIIMGLEGKRGQEAKAQQALQSLGIENYGRSNPRPIVSALRKQLDDEQSSGPRNTKRI